MKFKKSCYLWPRGTFQDGSSAIFREDYLETFRCMFWNKMMMKPFPLIIYAGFGLLLGACRQEPMGVTGVTLSATRMEMTVGETLSLTATLTPSGASAALVWESSEPAVVTVSPSGLVTAVSAGAAEVVVRAGSSSASCTIDVHAAVVPVVSVTLDRDGLQLGEGETARLHATILPEEASSEALTWTSVDPSVAIVSSAGVVTAVSVGETAVTVEAGGKTASCMVSVTTSPKVILYRTVDGNVLQPNRPASLGKVVSNTYENGWGRIECEGAVTAIGQEAFLNCNLLTSIVLPLRVTTIGNSAFRNCASLTSISLPDGVTSIEDDAFYLCAGLASISLPQSVSEIGIGAFSRCALLQSFDSVLAGEDGRYLAVDGMLVAFAPSGLTTYTIPSAVTGIAPSAFKYCGALQSLTIPASVEAIGEYAFFNSSSLRTITLLRDTPPALSDKNAFDSVSSIFKIYVPAASVTAYKSAPGWSSWASHIEAAQ